MIHFFSYRRGRLVAFAGIVLVGLAVYASWPRRVDLRHFNPDTFARLETDMWRNYYGKRWLPLVWDLYQVSREEFGFSPLDSVCLAVDAGRSSRLFRVSEGRGQAEKILPYLTSYYERIRERSGSSFDPKEIAVLEYEWWQRRRENGGTEVISGLIACQLKIIYGSDDPAIDESARLRVVAMQYRDSFGRKKLIMTDREWSQVAEDLTASYRLLSKAISSENASP